MTKSRIDQQPDCVLNPANDEMLDGYRDGRDLSNPEPSGNRSHSYRHSFACGRADMAMQPAFGGAATARRLANEAMAKDAAG